MKDIQLKLDKLIEEKVYNSLEPRAETAAWPGMAGWEKERDGRYYNYDYAMDTRTYHPRGIWPRHFSTCMQLAWELAEKFMIQMTPVKHIDGRLSGWLAERGEVWVEDGSATMAICLLVYILIKEQDGNNVLVYGR